MKDTKWPPITDAERARMAAATDFSSDAAVDRRAAELVARFGEDAYDRAVQHRESWPSSHAGHAFYSRVIVRILAPGKPAVPAEPSDASLSPACRPTREATQLVPAATDGSAGATHAGTPAPRWHDESDRRPHAKPKADDSQGSLF